jgi:hypothetical protein
LDAVSRFLEDDKLGVDIFAIRRKAAGGGAEELIAPLNHTSFTITKGDRLTAEVVITNKNIGHSFPPELRDFYEAYVEFIVSDDGGKMLYRSGFIKPDGYLDESAHNYKTYLVKADGTYNDKHHIWRTRVFAQNNFRPGAGRMFARVEPGEDMRGGTAELQRRFRRDRLDVRDAAHAIRSKDFLFLRHLR